MLIVLHTINLEPINVIDLEHKVYHSLITNGKIRLRVSENNTFINVYRKEVMFETEDINYIFIADNEEMCLALLPGFLPGQIHTVNQLKANQK